MIIILEDLYKLTTKAKIMEHIVCFNFYICSWIRATIGMYKTISTDAKNAPTWNTAISTTFDTKLPSKIHVTTQNMVLVIWHKKYIWNKSNWAMLVLIILKSYQNYNVIVFKTSFGANLLILILSTQCC